MHSSRMHTASSSSRVGEGVSAPVHAGIPPWVWPWIPLCCGPGDPPGCGPGDPPARLFNFPLGCGPEDPPGQTPQLPPRCGPGDLQGMLGYHLQCMLGYHPPPLPVNRIINTCKNITLPQLRLRAVIIQTLLFCCIGQQSLLSDYQDIVCLIPLLVIRSSMTLHKSNVTVSLRSEN